MNTVPRMVQAISQQCSIKVTTTLRIIRPSEQNLRTSNFVFHLCIHGLRVNCKTATHQETTVVIQIFNNFFQNFLTKFF